MIRQSESRFAFEYSRLSTTITELVGFPPPCGLKGVLESYGKLTIVVVVVRKVVVVGGGCVVGGLDTARNEYKYRVKWEERNEALNI